MEKKLDLIRSFERDFCGKYSTVWVTSRSFYPTTQLPIPQDWPNQSDTRLQSPPVKVSPSGYYDQSGLGRLRDKEANFSKNTWTEESSNQNLKEFQGSKHFKICKTIKKPGCSCDPKILTRTKSFSELLSNSFWALISWPRSIWCQKQGDTCCLCKFD